MNRRGSTMVEAAVVFPLVILTVITCILICMFCYDQTAEQCRMHMAMRAQAGELTGRTVCLRDIGPWEGQLSPGRSGIFRTINGKERIIMKNQGIVSERISGDLESLWHASDGVSYIRHCTLAKKLTDTR